MWYDMWCNLYGDGIREASYSGMHVRVRRGETLTIKASGADFISFLSIKHWCKFIKCVGSIHNPIYSLHYNRNL